MSKRIMHVSVAILCLALSYHIGSRHAGAQSPDEVIGDIKTSCAGGNAAVLNRVMYRGEGYSPTGPIPGTEPVIAVDGCDGWVMLANGDIYRWVGSEWQFLRDIIPGGPTPVKTETWGSVKARNR